VSVAAVRLQGPHKVTVRAEEYEREGSTSLPVRLAEESQGRYLLLTNLPYNCTKSDILQLFKGSKMLDYSLANSTTTYVSELSHMLESK
jgi:RNA recognition motif-containing protein